MVVSGTGTLTNGTAGATFKGGLSNDATVFVSANTFFNGPVTNTGAFFFQGAISNNFVSSAGAVELNNNATITGTATVSGGTFDLNGWTYTNGLMVVSGTGTLTNGTAGATFNGGLSNNATVFVSENTFFNGRVTNTGAFSFQGAISNNLVNSGSVTLNNNATITGTATVSGGFDLNGNTYTNGLMVVSGTGTLTNGIAGATFKGGLSNNATVFVSEDTFFNGPGDQHRRLLFPGRHQQQLG